MLVYSIVSPQSLKDIDGYREHILLVNEGRVTPPMVLVGNKLDLAANRQVPTAEGKRLADSYGIPFLETSALDGTNCDAVFHQVVRLAREQEESGAAKQETAKQKKPWKCTIL